MFLMIHQFKKCFVRTLATSGLSLSRLFSPPCLKRCLSVSPGLPKKNLLPALGFHDKPLCICGLIKHTSAPSVSSVPSSPGSPTLPLLLGFLSPAADWSPWVRSPIRMNPAPLSPPPPLPTHPHTQAPGPTLAQGQRPSKYELKDSVSNQGVHTRWFPTVVKVGALQWNMGVWRLVPPLTGCVT